MPNASHMSTLKTIHSMYFLPIITKQADIMFLSYWLFSLSYLSTEPVDIFSISHQDNVLDNDYLKF